MDHAYPQPGRDRATPPPLPSPRPARGSLGHTSASAPSIGDSEGRARVFVNRAITALGTLRTGTPASRELLRVMLQFLPAGALTSGRAWLPMGAAKLAAIAGITERSLARRVAELRALELLDRHLDRWNHPARAADGSRCGYDLAPLVERAAELNAALDRLFEDGTRARREARRSASLEVAERVREVAPLPFSSRTQKTGGGDADVTPIQTTNPDPIGSSVNSLGEDAVQRAHQPLTTHAQSEGNKEVASRAEGAPGPRRAGRLLSALSPDFAMLLRGVARDPDKPTEGDLLAAADYLAQHLGVPRMAWAGVAPAHDRLSLAAVVVLGQAQDESAFRSSRVAWVTAMLRRPGVNPWLSVHRALAQKARGLPAKPNRFLH
ncbi:helix-turn-helix domain-containing protein [Roseomonas harenae]|uniref:helix-turn-helix domain-containing protein n=1 Tax=Muricoccus harenae TaxID=2692566 RepID=UPI001331B1F5|nr:helix-turn-helix domain-containing protein [Roseomonas harenae]